jgi:hypothetical protein
MQIGLPALVGWVLWDALVVLLHTDEIVCFLAGLTQPWERVIGNTSLPRLPYWLSGRRLGAFGRFLEPRTADTTAHSPRSRSEKFL